MKSAANRRREILSLLFVCALFALCVVLGILQYRWIAEVNVTARDRMKEGLQSSLTRLSQDFDSEIASSCAALTPVDLAAGPQLLQNEVAERYTQWKKSARRSRIFDHIAIAIHGFHRQPLVATMAIGLGHLLGDGFKFRRFFWLHINHVNVEIIPHSLCLHHYRCKQAGNH